jgi:diketogulonate reductase-like aldo/keto reductase
LPPDSIGALAELKDSGKVRHMGVWNVTEAQLKRARASVRQWIG